MPRLRACSSDPAGVPKYATFPSARSMSLSNPKNTADDGWWMLVMMVLPARLARRSRMRMSATAEVESRPEVGSSSSTMDGSVRSSEPMLTRFFSPPETMKIGVSAHLASRSCLMIRSTSANFLGLVHDDGSRRKAVYVS
mmetsp:Transcript_33937/g.101267  ORF Transcript_33937/g.101267 Transcript_33937/m.101267 type:complete len:140 (-) Transcript_33937:860-1279(-)